jgi:hypothetical protein
LSTEDSDAAGPGRRAPEASAAPAGRDADAGGETRPRGRRFSGRPRSGQPDPGSRARGGSIPADVPTAAALDAISLNGDDRRSTAPQAAGAVVGSAATDASGEPGPGDPDIRLPGGTTGPGPAGRAPGAPAAATEVASDPRPAWPVSRRRGRELGADELAPSLMSRSILPDAGGAATAGPGPGSATKPGSGRTGRPAAGGAGLPAVGGEAGADAAAPPLFLLDASRAVLAWALQRQLGPSSATGIAVALAACAAAWFSSGTTADTVRGVAALWCSYLVLVAGRQVARQAASADAVHRDAGPVRWLAALGGSVAEATVYAGLAAGAAAQRYPGMWVLSVGLVGLVSVRNLMTACSTPYGLGQPPESLLGRTFAAAVTMAPGGRILIVGIVAPFWGARTALLVLLAWGISTVGYGLAGRAVTDVAAETRGEDGSDVASASLHRLRDDGMLARYLGALVRGSLLPLPPAILGLAAVTAFAVLGLHDLPGPLLIAPAFVVLLAAPGSANPHLGRFDWLVPVLLLSSQVLYIVAVGAGGRVPGPVAFALAAALLVRYTDLACPQRPVLLVKPRRRDSTPREYGTALGWEGRLLFIGITGAMGIATAGYLALTAYLVLLIGAKAVRSCMMAPDDGLT